MKTTEFKSLLEAYEATDEFQNYLAEKREWERLHKVYGENPDIVNRANLIQAMDDMAAALKKARKTPEHLAAFGW